MVFEVSNKTIPTVQKPNQSFLLVSVSTSAPSGPQSSTQMTEYRERTDTDDNRDSEQTRPSNDDQGNLYETHYIRPSQTTRHPVDRDEYDSDSDTESIHSEQSYSFLWGPKISEIIIRPPRSTEQCAQYYNETLKSPLQMFLSSVLKSYFMTMVVVTRDNEEDIPAVIVLYDPERDDGFPELSEFPQELFQLDEIVWILGEGDFRCLNKRVAFPKKGKYQQRLASGAGIGAKDDGTVGLFIRKERDVFYGITCGHILGKKISRWRVNQPWMRDYNGYLKLLENIIADLQQDIDSTTNDNTRFVRTEARDSLKKELENLNRFKGETDEDTRKNLRVGTTMDSELDVVEYRGRKCLSDYGVFVVDTARRPSGQLRLLESRPDEGILGTVHWQPAMKFAPLTFDALVRKNGRKTGETYGFVAGIHATWKPGGFEDKDSCEEFYVLEDKKNNQNKFAGGGDSGSSVIDNEGNIVGFVFAGIEITDVKMIMDKRTRIPDIAKIIERRQGDGGVDVENVYTDVFHGERFILVESAEMVIERSGVGEDFVRDC